MGVQQKLFTLQQKLVAQKDSFNKFGGYAYRSCESITKAAKPILAEIGATLIMSDEMVAVGNRIYVKATATLTDIETGESISNTAFAREAESQKGLQEAQLSGSTSSFARKYCVCGLLCIDDTKDPDTEEFHKQTHQPQQQQKQQQTPPQQQQQPQQAPQQPSENINFEIPDDLCEEIPYNSDTPQQQSQTQSQPQQTQQTQQQGNVRPKAERTYKQ